MRSELAMRLRSEWRLKLALSIALPAYFCLFYFGLQRVTYFPPRALSLSWIDRLIAFDPRWTAAYLSLYLFMPMPWIAATREELRRYASGFLVMTVIGFAWFFAFPVAGPRPLAGSDHALYAFVVSYDRNLNAFPSLHAGLAVYTLLLAIRLAGRARTVAIVAGGAWCALILFATMATKQHYAVDVAAGIGLAAAADALAWGYTAATQPEEV